MVPLKRCCLLVILFSILVPSIHAQCSIRPNLAALNEPPIPVLWDTLTTDTVRLGRVLTGHYQERTCWNTMGNNTGPPNATRTQMQTMSGCVQRREETLEIGFECFLERPEKNERCLQHSTVIEEVGDENGEKTVVKWRQVTINPGYCLSDEQDQLRCLLRPVMDPKYEALWTRYQSAKNEWTSDRFQQTFSGTHFPWSPCHDPALYSDNSIRLLNVREAAKQAPPPTPDGKPLSDRPTMEQGWCEVASTLALGSAGSLEWLNWARRQYPDMGWTSAKWEPIAGGHERDECARYWNQHQLVLKAGNYERRISYNMTRSQPLLENPFVAPGVIESQRQCYVQAEREARTRLERLRNRALVRARHPCHPSNANGNDEHAYFPAEYKWDWADFPLAGAPECMNSGELTHIWRAQSCGAHTDNWVIVRVRDTYPPVVNTEFLRLYGQPGRPLQQRAQGWIWNTCLWPENGFTRTAGWFKPVEDIPRLVRREILRNGNSMFEDQCDSVDQLQVLPDWNTAMWEYCSLVQDAEGVRHLLCTEQPQLKLAELAPGGGGFGNAALKVRDENLVVANALPRMLRMKVEIRVADACGNVATDQPILLQVGFFDPVDIPMGNYRPVQCPHFRYS